MNFNQALYAKVHNYPLLGSRVRVVKGISEMERNMARFPERVYVVDRYSEPNGYAVIKDEWGAWHVRPEALEVV